VNCTKTWIIHKNWITSVVFKRCRRSCGKVLNTDAVCVVSVFAVPSGLGGGVLKPSFDGPGLKDKFKAKSFLEKKDAVAVISSLIGEYDALCAEYNETGGPDRDTLIKEALTIAEEIITSAEQLNMVQMGSDWELLSSSNDLKEYNSFVQTIKSEVAKFWSIA